MNDNPRDWLPSYSSYVQERTEREKVHGVQWTEDIPYDVRRRIRAELQKVFYGLSPDTALRDVTLIGMEIMQHASRANAHQVWLEDALSHWETGSGVVVDWLAVLPIAVERVLKNTYYWRASSDFGSTPNGLDLAPFIRSANSIFLEERIGWVYLDSRLRKREDEPLHEDVILPVTAKLTGNPRFAQVEQLYQKAISHLATGDASQALTRTYAAVQQTFHALGVEGNDLGQLFVQAKERGFLLSADDKLLNVIRNLNGWFTGNRSARSEAHGAAKQREADEADARMSIHIAGAFILRLIEAGEQSGAVVGGYTEPPF